MAKKGKRRGSGKKMSLLGTAAGIASGAEVLGHFANTLRSIREGAAIENVIANLKQDATRAVSFGTAAKAAAPLVVYGGIKYVVNAVGVRSPTLGRRVKVL